MIERDIYRAARKMIDLYDLDTGWQAGLRADQPLDQGDVEGFHVWKRIVRAIRELQGGLAALRHPFPAHKKSPPGGLGAWPV